MKKIIISVFVIASFQLIYAQTSGTIVFSEARKLNINIEGASEEMLKKIPKTHAINKVLVFTAKESIYKNVDKSNDIEMNSNSDGAEMRMVFKVPESNLYNDHANGKMIHSQDLMDKLFLVKGDIKKKQWKITGESKLLLDYTCQKAILQDTASKVEAWFTTKLPANLGPQNFNGLPGAILMVDINSGEQTITASKIELRALNEGEIVMPTKGKEVTAEEFEKIKKEKMAEMNMSNGGSGGSRVIIRQTNGH